MAAKNAVTPQGRPSRAKSARKAIPNPSRSQADTPERRERRERVLVLARSGATYRQIGAALSISKDTAQRDLRDALAEWARPAAEEVRKMFVIRAEWMFARAAAGLERAEAVGDESAAIGWHRQLIAAHKRGSELEGVDEPKRLEITEITDDWLERECRKIMEEHERGGWDVEMAQLLAEEK